MSESGRGARRGADEDALGVETGDVFLVLGEPVARFLLPPLLLVSYNLAQSGTGRVEGGK